MKKAIFSPTDILLPKENFEAWSVIACDQFTSNEEYWQSVKGGGDSRRASAFTLDGQRILCYSGIRSP